MLKERANARFLDQPPRRVSLRCRATPPHPRGFLPKIRYTHATMVLSLIVSLIVIAVLVVISVIGYLINRLNV